MKFENQYIIHFKGLKEGIHEFEYKIDKLFFEEYKNLDVPDGNIRVWVELNKKINFMELKVNLNGSIQVLCDRCLTYFNLPVTFTGQLTVRFSETEKEPDDEVVILHPEENQISLKHYLYECISLSIPLRKIHPPLADGKSDCDPEMLEFLKQHLIDE